MESPQTDWIERLPKAELHLHIEGSLEPELMFELAQRNRVSIPYKSPEEVKEAYHFDDLQSFLDIYDASSNVLQTEQDFFDLTWAYLEKAHADNIRHTEIFFDPQTHTARGVKIETVFSGLTGALKKAESEWGLSSSIILSFLRHLSEEEAFATLEAAMPFRDQFIGVGLDSSEKGNPPEKFQRVFDRARSENLKLVAHAGEEGPPEYIWQALDLLKVDRIDHGVRCIKDEKLLERLHRDQIPLTVCPLSNVKLKVFRKLKDHNLKALLNKGLNVSLHSDDPSYFGGYLNDNYLESASALDLNTSEVKRLLENSFRSSFLSEERKNALIAELKSF